MSNFYCLPGRAGGSPNGLEDLRKDARFKYVEIDVDAAPEVRQWCLLSDISRLISYLSNIALEPAKTVKPEKHSRLVFKPCLLGQGHSITVEVTTYFGCAETARQAVVGSAKIAHDLDAPRRFGVKVANPLPAPEEPDKGLRFSLDIPVGFQPARR